MSALRLPDARRGRLAQSLVALVAVLLGAALAFGSGDQRIWLAVVLGVAILPMLMLFEDESLLLVVVLVVYLADWLSFDLHLLPAQVAWLIELCLVLLVFRLIGRTRRLAIPAMGPVWLAVGVVALSALTAAMRGAPILVLIAGARAYLRFPLIAGAIIAGGRRVGFAKAWRLLVVIALMQLPVSLVQWVSVGAGDTASGTFGPGGTGVAAVFLSAVGAVYFASRVERATPWQVRLVGLAAIMAPTVVGSAVAAYLLLPVGMVLVVLSDEKRIVGWLLRSLLALLVLAGLTLAGFQASAGLGYMDAGRLLSSAGAVFEYDQQITRSGSLGRLDKIAAAAALAGRGDVEQRALGRGPGMASPSGLGPGFEGPLYADPVVRLLNPSFSTSLLELGWVGLTGLGAAFCLMATAALRRVRAGGDGGRIAQVSLVAASLMIVTAVYTDTWTQPTTAALCWLSFAVVFAVDDESQKRKADGNEGSLDLPDEHRRR